MTNDSSGTLNGYVVVGACVALVILSLGIAVPLAGGTDLNGLPRIVGLAAASVVWVVAVVATLRQRQWLWFGVIVAFGPLPFIAYSAWSTGSLGNQESLGAFASAPWELLVIMLTPLPLILYGLRQGEH